MAPKKLTEADKTSILSLYRQPQETTSTLAERYGVSNSTISRLLKASLPEAEYSGLIQQKRSTTDKTVTPPALPQEAVSAKAKPRSKQKIAPQPDPPPVDESTAEAKVTETAAAPEPIETATSSTKPTRKRRSRTSEVSVTAADPDPESTQLSLPESVDTEALQAEAGKAEGAAAKPARPVLKSAQPALTEAAKPSADEVEADLDDDWDDAAALDDDYDDGDDDDSDDDGDEAYDWNGDDGKATPHLEVLEISPLTAAALPPLCYVVVERTSSELVVLPLRTFAELGQIPEDEGESCTLPVFENHNVARRFSRRNQRVVKVPDGTLLQTTSPYLQAKGITRLLIDGQVFSLGQDPVEPVVPIADE
ncbi:hypothetical protein IQ254_24985 [Nodosilinea sp. LEGE 07088]|uniref:MarR family winged helix-turn-helix transcriptional regulator n=1 Tax=Nodosilinea sp. LEGE 07088 TaxID=2777968 RepID=UPI00187F48D0|nr:MarR family winged helix-turn-helix transcriptional regulator [Nodosilinea sp. LEGE 07088]MBE9140416.1 hypothetical protein [Nodosilinea sp. LEGE 07088]